MITRGSIKKKSPATTTTTTTTTFSLNNNNNINTENNNQVRRTLGQRVVTIKEPSPEKSTSSRSPASISPPSDTDRGVNNNNNQQHALFQQQQSRQQITNPNPNQNNSNTNNNSSLINSMTSSSSPPSLSESEYIRVLKSTIAEQRRHLDVARFAIEQEISEKQTAAVQALESQERAHQLLQQLNACRAETEQFRNICDHQRVEIVGLKQQLSEQLTTNQLLSRAADEERANAARMLNERDKLREEFEANERVFKELLGALREKEKMPSSMAAAAELSMQLKQQQQLKEQQEREEKQKQDAEKKRNKSKNSKHKHDDDDEDEENRPPEVWISAWKQLQQRRLFEKGQSLQ